MLRSGMRTYSVSVPPSRGLVEPPRLGRSKAVRLSSRTAQPLNSAAALCRSARRAARSLIQDAGDLHKTGTAAD
jgi:hypothetical protein